MLFYQTRISTLSICTIKRINSLKISFHPRGAKCLDLKDSKLRLSLTLTHSKHIQNQLTFSGVFSHAGSNFKENCIIIRSMEDLKDDIYM